MTVADQPVAATVSVGIASGEPGADIIAMIAAADRALYMAKMNGRNRVELADERPSAAPRDERLDPLSETTSGPIPTPALAS